MVFLSVSFFLKRLYGLPMFCLSFMHCWAWPFLSRASFCFIQLVSPVSSTELSIAGTRCITSTQYPKSEPLLLSAPSTLYSWFLLSLNNTIHPILQILTSKPNTFWMCLLTSVSTAPTTRSLATILTASVTLTDKLVSWLSVLSLLICSPHTRQADFAETRIWAHHPLSKALQRLPSELLYGAPKTLPTLASA